MPTYTIRIPNWHPSRTRDIIWCNWASSHRMAKAARERVQTRAKAARVPIANSRRRVNVVVTRLRTDHHMDGNAFWRCIMDALVSCQIVRAHDRTWCARGSCEVVTGRRRSTVIILEDI